MVSGCYLIVQVKPEAITKYTLEYGTTIDPKDIVMLRPTCYQTKKNAREMARKVKRLYEYLPVIIIQDYGEGYIVVREVIK